MDKLLQKIIAIPILLVLMCTIAISFCGCMKYLDDYTIEEHIKNISKRVEKKYLKEDETYNIYPLYSQNEDEAIEYFLVEFSSNRCLFIRVRETDFEFRLLNGKYSIYAYCERFEHYPWTRYILEENMNKTAYGNQIHWSAKKKDNIHLHKYGAYCEIDDNGEQVEYSRSPYNAANVLSEKLYLLHIESYYWYIPAIKIGENTYVNLISMAEFNTLYDISNQEVLPLSFILDPHEHF